jgi:hypothetical protein
MEKDKTRQDKGREGKGRTWIRQDMYDEVDHNRHGYVYIYKTERRDNPAGQCFAL